MNTDNIVIEEFKEHFGQNLEQVTLNEKLSLIHSIANQLRETAPSTTHQAFHWFYARAGFSSLSDEELVDLMKTLAIQVSEGIYAGGEE